MGVLSAGLLRVNEKLTPHTETSEQRNALFASYVIGIETCERAIEEGRYLQAVALLRQEMETVAQLKAVAVGKRKEERSPNISFLPKSIARLYGDLSAGAHVSKHSIVRTATEWEVSIENLPGPTIGTRHFPAFDGDLARRCFALHLMLTLKVIQELSEDLHAQQEDVGFNEQDFKAVDLAVQLMALEGVLELQEDL